MTAALEGGEWSAARPGRTLPPGNTRYPFYGRLGGPQGQSGRAENLVPTGIFLLFSTRITSTLFLPFIRVQQNCTTELYNRNVQQSCTIIEMSCQTAFG